MSDLISNITGVVMAGGKSKRMGTDKGLMNFNGRPMVSYAIELFSDLFSQVMISSNNDEYEKFGLPVISDVHKNCGPLCGLHAVLTQITTDKVFVISCDMPFVTRGTIEEILLCQEACIAVASHSEFLEPLCGIYSKALLLDMNNRIKNGNFKMYRFIKEQKLVKYVNVNPAQFININSPDDVKEIKL